MSDISVKGIILAGGSATRLYPVTKVINKHLLPIYDKPMIYYPLSILMQANIRDILIITTKNSISSFRKLLGNGSKLGIKISYIVQDKPNGLAEAFILGEDFINNNPCIMILGDNIFYNKKIYISIKSGINNAINGYATIFGYKVKNPSQFGVMNVKNGNIISVEEKPRNPKSNYAITGLYIFPPNVSLFAKNVKHSPRGELEVTSLIECYLRDNKLKYTIFDKESVWYDAGTFDSLLEVSNKIRDICMLSNDKKWCLCDIAKKNGWIDNNKE